MNGDGIKSSKTYRKAQKWHRISATKLTAAGAHQCHIVNSRKHHKVNPYLYLGRRAGARGAARETKNRIVLGESAVMRIDLKKIKSFPFADPEFGRDPRRTPN